VELSDIKSNFLFSKRLYKLLNEERVWHDCHKVSTSNIKHCHKRQLNQQILNSRKGWWESKMSSLVDNLLL
jgi:hypothetical protein